MSEDSVTVAQVIARLNVGGAAIQAILITAGLRQRLHRALLLSGEVCDGEASMKYLAARHDVAPVQIAGLRRSLSGTGDLRALLQLIRVFRRERPDIVHTHTAKAGTLGRLAAWLTGVPVRVHTFHGHVFDGYFPRPLTWAIVAVERVLARFTDCLVAVSESQRRELWEVYRVAPAEKIVTIPVALEIESFLQIRGREGELRAKLGCSADEFLVGWVGRFAPVKQPNLLLACANLLLPGLPCRFVMVGDGKLRANCEQKIRTTGLTPWVTILGWERHLSSIYADVDVVVLTSENEGTPVTLLECMASARPFVATDAGGVRDLMVGKALNEQGFQQFDNGILVARRNPGLIANALRYLAAQPELCARMGQAGREFVRSRFSPQRLADNLERLYLTLLKAKNVRAGRSALAHPTRT